ncbi:unnamed protein product [marine sediment metagenome]|uniref:Uncharacterized protein n=1 Tax=marine sediment metagenome TaxID=412755 RepID=X0XAR1_9ZZZZ
MGRSPNKKKLPTIGKELITRFSQGDLVSWTEMIHDKTGIVLEIFMLESGNREFPCAKVYVMGEDERSEVLLTNLINLSRRSD